MKSIEEILSIVKDVSSYLDKYNLNRIETKVLFSIFEEMNFMQGFDERLRITEGQDEKG